MSFFAKKLSYTLPVKEKGLPVKLTVDVHGCSSGLNNMMSIPVLEVKDGNVVIGFFRKGDKIVKAIGLHDMKAILALRRFILNLHWDGKEREAVVTRPLLLKLHAEITSDGAVDGKKYMDELMTRLGLP